MFWKLTELRYFVTYLSSDPRTRDDKKQFAVFLRSQYRSSYFGTFAELNCGSQFPNSDNDVYVLWQLQLLSKQDHCDLWGWQPWLIVISSTN